MSSTDNADNAPANAAPRVSFDEIVSGIPCPSCNQRRGDPCRTLGYREATVPHGARRTLAYQDWIRKQEAEIAELRAALAGQAPASAPATALDALSIEYGRAALDTARAQAVHEAAGVAYFEREFGAPDAELLRAFEAAAKELRTARRAVMVAQHAMEAEIAHLAKPEPAPAPEVTPDEQA